MLRLDTWIRELAALVLLAGIAELLLPTGRMKGYARSLLGLLVLLGVLQPLVGLVHGQISLQLPAIGAPTLATSATDQAAVAAAGQSFERLVAGQVVRIAEQEPGVASASATVTFAANLRTPQAAQVWIATTGAGLSSAAVTGQVRAAVASGLGVSPNDVTVQDW